MDDRSLPGHQIGQAGCPCGEVMEIVFDEEPKPLSTPKRASGWKEAARVGNFELIAFCDDGRVVVPRFVVDPAEAQFIAERANAVLATDGRIVDRGYRGERIRIATDEPGEQEIEAEEEEATKRASREGRRHS